MPDGKPFGANISGAITSEEQELEVVAALKDAVARIGVGNISGATFSGTYTGSHDLVTEAEPHHPADLEMSSTVDPETAKQESTDRAPEA